MPAAEFAEWQAFYSIEPFGEERADLRMGLMSSLYAETKRNRKKRATPFKPSEFMPDFWGEIARQRIRSQFSALVAKMKAHNLRLAQQEGITGEKIGEN